MQKKYLIEISTNLSNTINHSELKKTVSPEKIIQSDSCFLLKHNTNKDIKQHVSLKLIQNKVVVEDIPLEINELLPNSSNENTYLRFGNFFPKMKQLFSFAIFGNKGMFGQTDLFSASKEEAMLKLNFIYKELTN